MKKLFSLVGLGALLAAAANAQTWPVPTTSGNFSVRKASITSATVIAAAPVRDTSSRLSLVMQGATAPITATITVGLTNGDMVSTSTVLVPSATALVVDFTAPINFQNVKVSPSTIGTDTLKVNIVQSK
ncbi:hypothetical protein QWJ07_03935 [Frankia sp. RB7]|nr:hypothetical protein [Frankia sp. RB7]